MKLLKLTLRNFKGIKFFELNPNGNNIAVYGDNATGKTTLKDSFSWLLYGKDSNNKVDFDIKTIDPITGEAIHNLEHEVEGTLEVDGKELILRKSYYEKWERKRGLAERTFTGHTTDYFLNKVPVKKNEYEQRISKIAGGEGIFKLLTDPGYFNEQLHWQKRREVLLSVCGSVEDKDVIASDSNLTQLKSVISRRSLEEHKKIVDARRKEINKELEKIPVRIDEVVQGLPDVTKIKANDVSSESATLKQKKQDKEKEALRVESGGEVAEKTKKLREIESELIDIRNKHREGNEGEVDKLRKLLFDAKDKMVDLSLKTGEKEGRIKFNKIEIESSKSKIEWLRKDWHEVDSEQFAKEFKQDDVCYACGQKLPKEFLEETREKALKKFNKEKAGKLERITEEGKEEKERLDGLQETNIKLGKEVEELQEEQFPILVEEAEEIQKQIDTFQKHIVDISQNEQYGEKLKEKEKLESDIKLLKEGNGKTLVGIRKQIEVIQREIDTLEHSVTQVKQYAKGEQRFKELKVKEKELAKEYEKLEKEIYLIEQFIRAKVGMLEEKINSKFKMAKFKLFNLLINQGVEECCVTVVNGVSYNISLNHGAQIAVGLDIINTLSQHYGFEAPCFIDNAEAFTALPETKAQTIKLYVSEKDKSLRVEVR